MIKSDKSVSHLIPQFASHLNEENAILSQEQITSARVPILKITEKETKIPMDICFNILDNNELWCLLVF